MIASSKKESGDLEEAVILYSYLGRYAKSSWGGYARYKLGEIDCGSRFEDKDLLEAMGDRGYSVRPSIASMVHGFFIRKVFCFSWAEILGVGIATYLLAQSLIGSFLYGRGIYAGIIQISIWILALMVIYFRRRSGEE